MFTAHNNTNRKLIFWVSPSQHTIAPVLKRYAKEIVSEIFRSMMIFSEQIVWFDENSTVMYAHKLTVILLLCSPTLSPTMTLRLRTRTRSNASLTITWHDWTVSHVVCLLFNNCKNNFLRILFKKFKLVYIGGPSYYPTQLSKRTNLRLSHVHFPD